MMTPFAGLKVVDLSRLLAGPYCSQLLADLGATVIKVEPLQGDDARHLGPPFIDGNGIFFLAANGGKSSVAVDFTRPKGRDVVLRLCEQADVVIENFRPGTVERLGLAYDDVRASNPGVVYCSISGFGASGPMRGRGGVDTIFQAMGGLVAAIDGPDGAPLKVNSPVADIAAAQSAALAVAAALASRERTGEGGHVEVAIRDALAALLTPLITYALVTGENPPRSGNASQFAAPADIFGTSDAHVAVSVINDKHWRRLCEAVGREDLAADPRFAEPSARLANRTVLTAELQRAFRTRSTARWMELLNARGIPAGPILEPTEIAGDPQLAENGLLITLDGRPAVGLPFRFAGAALDRRAPVPDCGEHTCAVLAAHGYSGEEISELLDDQIVRQSKKTTRSGLQTAAASA